MKNATPAGFRNVSTSTVEKYQTEDGNATIQRIGPRSWAIMPRGRDNNIVNGGKAIAVARALEVAADIAKSEADAPPVPACLAGMGCLCVLHARDGAADAPCDAHEGVPYSFGKERTSGQCYARAAWEHEQHAAIRKESKPGSSALAAAHARTAAAYEERAQEIARTEEGAYTFKLADGRTISGRVQGSGGTIAAGQHKRVRALIDRANEGEPLGVYEPATGCVALKFYNPDGPDHVIVISLIGAVLL